VCDARHAHHRHQDSIRLPHAIAKHSLEGILQNVKQDILVTEGEQDHLFNTGWMHR